MGIPPTPAQDEAGFLAQQGRKATLFHLGKDHFAPLHSELAQRIALALDCQALSGTENPGS